jgi:Tfp pilus assembly protein PilV
MFINTRGLTLAENERGFTLIEAMVAMMVCTIGLVAMAELMAVTLRLQQLGRNSTSAVRLAQDKVDELTSMPFNPVAANYNAQVSCGGDLDANDPDGFHSDTPMEDNGTPDNPADDTVTKGYTRRWIISDGPIRCTIVSPSCPVANVAEPTLRTVTVRVIPDVADRRTATPYQLTTIIRGTAQACP